MIEQKKINTVITEGLKGAAGCEVIKANLAGAPIPAYPYISFTILNSETGKGTYVEEGNRHSIPMKQTWSFTVQGDDDEEALITAMLARDWLEEAGRLGLNDNGIVVGSVGAITSRDTLLTVNYEYRKGFDAVLYLINSIEMPDAETIEIVTIEKE